MNRYPDPDATLLRRRIAERYETEPGRVAVGNGSCEILLAAAEALCEPGAEILYAWPSFSMYPYLAALTGAREIRVPLADGEVHDLDAMAAEVTAATQLVDRLQPQQPDRDPPAGGRDRRLLRARPRPRHDRPRRGLRRVPDRRRPRRDDRPARRVPQPRRPAHLQQGLRPRRPAGRLRDRLAEVPRRDRRRAPAVQRQRPRPGRRRPRRSCTQDDVERRVERTIAERIRVEEGLRELGLCTADTQANFSWIDLGDLDEERSSPPWPSAGSRSAREPRSATPATSASATAPRPRTTASSPPSARFSSWPDCFRRPDCFRLWRCRTGRRATSGECRLTPSSR